MLGTLYVVAAPSGAGKTSLVNALLQQEPEMVLSVSHTTRPARPGEQSGINYHFVDEAEFKHLVQEKIFLEYAEVFGHYYGTSKHWVEQQLNAGKDVILEIDWQGARLIRAQFSDSLSIFILPPSFEVLEQRLQARNQDKAEVIERRLAEANEEIMHYKEFDYVIVNDIFERTLQDLRAIVQARRLITPVQAIKYADLLADLLQTR